MKTLTEEFIDKINKMESKSIGVILVWANELRIKQDQQTKELREEIERLKESKWISVEDRLPEKHTSCIVFSMKTKTNNSFVTESDFDGKYFYHPYHGQEILGVYEHITHWQPLPNNPI